MLCSSISKKSKIMRNINNCQHWQYNIGKYQKISVEKDDTISSIFARTMNTPIFLKILPHDCLSHNIYFLWLWTHINHVLCCLIFHKINNASSYGCTFSKNSTYTPYDARQLITDRLQQSVCSHTLAKICFASKGNFGKRTRFTEHLSDCHIFLKT